MSHQLQRLGQFSCNPDWFRYHPGSHFHQRVPAQWNGFYYPLYGCFLQIRCFFGLILIVFLELWEINSPSQKHGISPMSENKLFGNGMHSWLWAKTLCPNTKIAGKWRVHSRKHCIIRIGHPHMAISPCTKIGIWQFLHLPPVDRWWSDPASEFPSAILVTKYTIFKYRSVLNFLDIPWWSILSCWDCIPASPSLVSCWVKQPHSFSSAEGRRSCQDPLPCPKVDIVPGFFTHNHLVRCLLPPKMNGLCQNGPWS